MYPGGCEGTGVPGYPYVSVGAHGDVVGVTNTVAA